MRKYKNISKGIDRWISEILMWNRVIEALGGNIRAECTDTQRLRCLAWGFVSNTKATGRKR